MNEDSRTHKLNENKNKKYMTQEDKTYICSQIHSGLWELTEEMNIRLFLTEQTGKMFFVESIEVTDIQFLQKKQKSFKEKIIAWIRKMIKRFAIFAVGYKFNVTDTYK